MSGRAWITGADKIWASYVTISPGGGGWIVEMHMGRLTGVGKLNWFYHPPLMKHDDVDKLPSFTFEECVEKVKRIMYNNKLRIRIRNIQTDEIVSGAIIE